MSRTRFNKLHKYTICINNHDYRIVHVPLPGSGCYCNECDCGKKDHKYKQDCLEEQISNPHWCGAVIGRHGVLKLIKHVKNKV